MSRTPASRRRRQLQASASGFFEATQLEVDLTVEGPVDGDLLASRLEGPPHQEQGTIQVVQVEDGLGLQIVDLGLGAAVETRELGRARHQIVAEPDRLLELDHVLDQQLDPVQVRRDELGVGGDGALVLVQRLVDGGSFRENLAALIVGFGAVGEGSQCLVEPGERFFRAPRCGKPPWPGQDSPSSGLCPSSFLRWKRGGWPQLVPVENSRTGLATGLAKSPSGKVCNLIEINLMF